MTNPVSKDADAALARIDWELKSRVPDWLVEWENSCLTGGEAWQFSQLDAARRGATPLAESPAHPPEMFCDDPRCYPCRTSEPRWAEVGTVTDDSPMAGAPVFLGMSNAIGNEGSEPIMIMDETQRSLARNIADYYATRDGAQVEDDNEMWESVDFTVEETDAAPVTRWRFDRPRRPDPVFTDEQRRLLLNTLGRHRDRREEIRATSPCDMEFHEDLSGFVRRDTRHSPGCQCRIDETP